MRSRRAVAALTAFVVVLAGCRSSGPAEDDPPPLRPEWQVLALPDPPGPPGRLILRDVASCTDRWYVVGGVGDETGATRPAAWTSLDGSAWTPVPIAATTYYGRQNVLYSVACRKGRAAVLGAKNGGVHGNPRTSSWRQLPDGTLSEVQAPFELYGGPRAVNVARIVGGASGWLTVGSRIDGAAVWLSADAGRFELVEGVPELAGDFRGRSFGHDAAAADSRWVLVGSLLPTGGTSLVPLAWTSVDGRVWRRAVLPAPGGRGQAQRVVSAGGSIVAIGLRGNGFGAWRSETDGWRSAGGFDSAAGPGVLSVDGAAAVDTRLVVATGDGIGHALWLSVDSGDSWRSMELPAPVPDGGDTAVALAADESRLVLVADTGESSWVWWTGSSALAR